MKGSAMPEKDPMNYGLITYFWVTLLAAWGGAVNWLRKRKAGEVRPFNFMELIGELLTSAFAGVLTFWLCEASGLPSLITAAMVGISGHMGSRSIYLVEKWLETRFSKLEQMKGD